MQVHLRAAVALLLLWTIPCSLAGDVATRADAYLRGLVEQEIFSGAVLIAREGNILLRKGYGYANHEHDIPNTPETKFRIGSITKQFTASAIMQLQENGKLRVEDTIRIHMPDFPSYGDRIRIHHLLTHSSGLHEYGADEPRFRKQMMLPRNQHEVVARMTAEPPAFEPGERYRYSNAGFFLLGMFVEQLSGQPYEDYLRKNFFEPLGMFRTGYDHNRSIVAGRASGYARGPDGLLNAVYIDMSNPFSAGALHSTVDDLYRWDRALYGEAILKQSTLQTMFQPHMRVHDRQDYGYGWVVGKQHGHFTVQHGGGINGFRARLIRLVEDHAVIIVLSNFEHAPMDRIPEDLLAILFGLEPELDNRNEK